MTDCLKAACHESGAALDYEIEHLYEGFDIPEDHPFLLELSGIFRSMGISPFTASSGGGSDANALNAMGIMAVNLGVGMTRGTQRRRSWQRQTCMIRRGFCGRQPYFTGKPRPASPAITRRCKPQSR